MRDAGGAGGDRQTVDKRQQIIQSGQTGDDDNHQDNNCRDHVYIMLLREMARTLSHILLNTNKRFFLIPTQDNDLGFLLYMSPSHIKHYKSMNVIGVQCIMIHIKYISTCFFVFTIELQSRSCFRHL